MDPIVESALIAAAATVVGVGSTVTMAIVQLGADKLDVRIGGIYALNGWPVTPPQITQL